jgi:hypothetical protein
MYAPLEERKKDHPPGLKLSTFKPCGLLDYGVFGERKAFSIIGLEDK